MGTTFFLVRHGSHDLLGRVLAGRMEGVPLNGLGRAEALAVARRLAAERLTALGTSPLLRTRETAAPIGAACRLAPEIAPALIEIDFGAWTGRGFDSLASDAGFQAWNTERATARPPGGETMAEAQARVVGHLARLAEDHPDGRIALVAHGDIIKSAVAHHLCMSLDRLSRIEIDPASVTTIVVGAWGARLLSLNERVRPAEIEDVQPPAAAAERAA